MDIKIIEDTIKMLETSLTTADNVQELANLYTVRDNLLKKDTNTVEQELNDILPAYKKYCETKRKYQLGELTEEPVIHDMQLLGQELKEFILALYSNTDFYRERKILITLISDLQLD